MAVRVISALVLGAAVLAAVTLCDTTDIDNSVVPELEATQDIPPKAPQDADDFDKWWGSVTTGSNAPAKKAVEAKKAAAKKTTKTKKATPKQEEAISFAETSHEDLDKTWRHLIKPKKTHHARHKGVVNKKLLGANIKWKPRSKRSKDHLPVPMSTILDKKVAQKNKRSRKMEKEKRRLKKQAWIQARLVKVLGNMKAVSKVTGDEDVKEFRNEKRTTDFMKAEDTSVLAEAGLQFKKAPKATKQRKHEGDSKLHTSHEIRTAQFMHKLLHSAAKSNAARLPKPARVRLMEKRKAKQVLRAAREIKRKAAKRTAERREKTLAAYRRLSSEPKRKKKKAVPVVKAVKAKPKPEKPVVFFSSHMFSHEHKQEKKKPTEDSATASLLGDMGLAPKVKVVPVNVEMNPNDAFVAKTMNSIMNDGDILEESDDHLDDDLSEIDKSDKESAIVLVPAKNGALKQPVPKAHPKPSAPAPAKAVPHKDMDADTTATLIASLKQVGMTEEAADLEESQKHPTRKVAPQHKIKKLADEATSSTLLLVERLNSAGMNKEANALAAELAKQQQNA